MPRDAHPDDSWPIAARCATCARRFPGDEVLPSGICLGCARILIIFGDRVKGELADREAGQLPPGVEAWRGGLHRLHCREDRCGPHGERCDCPCHHPPEYDPGATVLAEDYPAPVPPLPDGGEAIG
jgi:hypothetical protein